jgi:hypothetical protein
MTLSLTAVLAGYFGTAGFYGIITAVIVLRDRRRG